MLLCPTPNESTPPLLPQVLRFSITNWTQVRRVDPHRISRNKGRKHREGIALRRADCVCGVAPSLVVCVHHHLKCVLQRTLTEAPCAEGSGERRRERSGRRCGRGCGAAVAAVEPTATTTTAAGGRRNPHGLQPPAASHLQRAGAAGGGGDAGTRPPP
jgi:hypothetical protein